MFSTYFHFKKINKSMQSNCERRVSVRESVHFQTQTHGWDILPDSIKKRGRAVQRRKRQHYRAALNQDPQAYWSTVTSGYWLFEWDRPEQQPSGGRRK